MAKKQDGDDYDYVSAYMAKIFGLDLYDKKSKHWGSRVPNTPITDAIGLGGRILKSQDHETFDKTIAGEQAANHYLASDKNRNLISIPGQRSDWINNMAKKNKTPKVVRLSEMPEPAPRDRPTGDAFILDPNARYSQYSQMAKPKTSGPEDAPVNSEPRRLVNPATNLPYAGEEMPLLGGRIVGDVIDKEQSGRHKKPLGDRKEFDPKVPRGDVDRRSKSGAGINWSNVPYLHPSSGPQWEYKDPAMSLFSVQDAIDQGLIEEDAKTWWNPEQSFRSKKGTPEYDQELGAIYNKDSMPLAPLYLPGSDGFKANESAITGPESRADAFSNSASWKLDARERIQNLQNQMNEDLAIKTGQNSALGSSNPAPFEPEPSEIAKGVRDDQESRTPMASPDSIENRDRSNDELNNLSGDVAQERQSEIFKPSNLTAAGRSEFDAAARGEIPGYAIKDPSARAAFSKAREYDIGFGSKERQRSDAIHSPDGPDHPWDQDLMDGLEVVGSQQDRESQAAGVNKVDAARIRTYEEAKKNGRLSVYHGDDIQRFEKAIKRRDEGESNYARGLRDNHEYSDKSDGDFYYEAMGERAQKGQQPRSAGGVGDGPLSADNKGQGKYGTTGRDFGTDTAAKGSHGAYSRRRFQNQNRGYATGGNTSTRGRFQNEPPRGSSGGGGGRGVAYPEQPLPASQRDPNSSEGGAYSLPGGGMIPNPDGMSESDFNDAVFNNPVPMEEAFQYAMENGQMTKAEQEELQQLQTQGYPASVSPHQREAYDANRKATLGKLASNVFRKNIRHAEVQRSKDARDRTAEANSERVERDRLARIYRQKINPKTKNKMGEFGFLMPEFMGDTDLVEEATRALTDKEFLAAKAWDAKETAAYRESQGKVAGEVKAAEAGQAPPSSEPHWTFAKSDQDKIYGGLSNTSGTEYGIWSQDDKLYLRMTVKEWDAVAPEDRSNVAGIILPPQGANPTQWSNPGMQVMSLPRGVEFVTAGPDGVLQVQDYNSDAARPEATPPEAAKSAPLPGVTF